MSSGFITEAEIAERRRVRQEEWDKVRKPGQPEEAPEEEYDPRSLYERLEEQKQKRDLEYEEAHKLKNMIKGLDDDEVEFLDLVDRSKLEEERRKTEEEEREIKDFRNAVATLQEKSLQSRINAEIRPKPTNNNSTNSGTRGSSQVKLLAGAVVRKRTSNDNISTSPNEKKICLDQNENSNGSTENRNSNHSNDTNDNIKCQMNNKSSSSPVSIKPPATAAGLRCIGILPGLGSYPDSSDSEASSDTDQELYGPGATYDLVGRKVKDKCDDKDDDHDTSKLEKKL